MMLINSVVQGLTINVTHRADRIHSNSLGVPWLPDIVFNSVGMIVFIGVLQLVLFAASSLLNTLRNISQQLLQNSVSMRIQLMVMEKAASLDLQFYEDPASYDLLRRAQNDSINRPVLMIATVFGLFQTVLTFITMIGGLVVVSPLLAAISLVSPVPAFIAETRCGGRGYNIGGWGLRLVRRMNYMVALVTTDSFAKEVKLFGLGGYFIERYRLIASAFYSSQRSQLVRRYMTGFALGNISTIVTTVTYVYVALLAIARSLTIGHLSFYTHAGSHASTEGSILSDGLARRDFDHHAPPRQGGAMSWDYVAYRAPAAENIGLGNVPEIADRNAVVSASKQAGSDELIANLPEGYDTALGKWFDAGVNLSGGEWQKGALARSFMREDARILLLDEPTSALDAQADGMAYRSAVHQRAPAIAGAILGGATAAAYLVGANRSFGYDAAATFANFVATPSLWDAFAIHSVLPTVPIKLVASNDHVLLSLLSHLIYSLTGSRAEVVYRLLPVLAAGGAGGLSTTVLARRLGMVAGGGRGLVLATDPRLVHNSRDLPGV